MAIWENSSCYQRQCMHEKCVEASVSHGTTESDQANERTTLCVANDECSLRSHRTDAVSVQFTSWRMHGAGNSCEQRINSGSARRSAIRAIHDSVTIVANHWQRRRTIRLAVTTVGILSPCNYSQVRIHVAFPIAANAPAVLAPGFCLSRLLKNACSV